ncbi:MAG TPA: PQQ-binding-like beta-propeller repeat protein [Ktedonobacteraceae bacterium]|nr:PQQ-binding-like beta-propeller repeat protein [Ktedonobacteraceae bacterium]
MKADENNLPGQDEVEITDLGSPEQTSNSLIARAAAGFMQKVLTPRKRLFICLMSVLILLLILLPVIQSGSFSISRPTVSNPGRASAPSQPHLNDISVADGRAYILAADGTLEAHRTSDGKLLWQHQVGFPPTAYLWAVYDILYIAWPTDTNGGVAALRGSDGSFLWEHQTPPPGPSSLLVKDGIVYVNGQGGSVEALRSSNGSFLWYFISGLDMPLDGFLSVANGTASILTRDSMVYVLRASNGSRILRYQADPSDNNPWAPFIDGDTMYIARGTNEVQALRMSDGKPLWQYTSPGNALELLTVADGIAYISTTSGTIEALRDKDGSLLWQYQTREVFGGAPLVANGVTYIATFDGTIIALRTSDGSLLWQHQVDALGFRYSPILQDGILYVALSDGSLEALRPGDGSILWHYTSKATILWYPRVVDGLMYVRHINGTMDVLQSSTGKFLWRYPATS